MPDAKIAVPLKYFINFCQTLEISLRNCKINVLLTWSSTYAITNSTEAGTFAITDSKPYVPFITLSTQDNAKLHEQLNSDFKRTINWYKYQSKK